MSVAWFVVNTKPQQEARAAVELANQDFEVFLPIMNSKPMFPRYLFARFDRDQGQWGKIRSTYGCCDVLKNGVKPSPVADEIIDLLRTYRPPVEQSPAQMEFTKGQLVRITEGPCQGIEGLFQADEKRRVYALLEVCGKPFKVPRQSIRAA